MGEWEDKARGDIGLRYGSYFIIFSGSAITSEIRVIIGQKLKVRGWLAIAVEFTYLQMDMIARMRNNEKVQSGPTLRANETLNVFPSSAQPSPAQLNPTQPNPTQTNLTQSHCRQ